MRNAAISFFAITWLAACASPVADIQTLSEQDLPNDASRLEARPSPQEMQGGLLSRLFGGRGGPGTDIGADTGSDTSDAADPVQQSASAAIAEAEPERETRRSGFFGLFGGGSEDREAEVETQTAALAPKSDEAEEAGGGFLGLRGGTASAKSEIAYGTVLPYGRVARICGVPARRMGKKIDSFPERRAKFTLYDSDPGNTAAHTFYVTGFDDGCARQFTGSLAVFGSVTMHEQLRYGLPAEVQPYSDTDKAYEVLKARVCRVPRRKPCGARISRLERDTVFLSIYERFGSNATWKNLLLHDGDVLAQDIKGG